MQGDRTLRSAYRLDAGRRAGMKSAYAARHFGPGISTSVAEKLFVGLIFQSLFCVGNEC